MVPRKGVLGLGAPLASLLPFVLVLACPLMMIFMMRGMAGSHGAADHTVALQADRPPAPRQDVEVENRAVAVDAGPRSS